jgi:D-alanyl-D-alanine carboxypeptidase
MVTIIAGLSCKKTYEPGSNNDKNPHNDEYNQYLDRYIASTQAPGAILFISRPGETDWLAAKGLANVEDSIAMSANTQFRIASITKVFISTLIIKLCEERKLSLTDKLIQVLPEVGEHIPHADKIMVRHLLGHLSGLTDPVNDDPQYQQDIINDPAGFGNMSALELLDKYIYNKELLFEPGSQYSYSNAGYWILGLMAEKVTNKSLPGLLQQKIYKPLHLTHTYLEKKNNDNVAKEYAYFSPDAPTDVTAWDAAEADGKAAGGIISSAADIAVFYTALFNGKIISPLALAEMKNIQLENCSGPDCEYGLGLEVWHEGNHTGYGHNGSLAGMEANALYFPAKKTTIILYKNLGGGSDKSFFENILND